MVKPVMPSRRLNPMLPDWKEISDRIPTLQARYRVGPVLRFLSEEGIGPEAVTESDLIRYRDQLLADSFRGDPQERWDALLWEWNKCVREVEGFPHIELPRESRRVQKSFGWDAFPASLREEMEGWTGRLSNDDPLGDGPLKPVTQSTKETRLYQVQYFASALVRAGVDPSTLKSLAELVSLKNFETGMRFLFDEKARTKSSHLAGIGGALIAIARHWVLPKSGLSDSEVAAIFQRMRRINSAVSPSTEGLTDKNHERILQFESEEAIGRFLNLPDELRAKITRGKIPLNQKHAMADVALALEILFAAPIRMKNLSGIELDKNLIRHRDGYMLVFKSDEVKNKERLNYKLPPETCAAIDWYMKTIRSERVRGETNALFVGEDGIRLKAQHTLSQQIANKVKEYTGLKFNAHLIRHVASFLFLTKVPGGHHVMRLVLGHKSVETLVRAYSGAESKSAHALYDGVIRDLRTRHAPVKKRGRPVKPAASEKPDYSKMPLPDHGRLKKRGR
ncbi:MAG: tyrosine-type recombinase/integrase [Alphaproteobacteria bacterium]